MNEIRALKVEVAMENGQRYSRSLKVGLEDDLDDVIQELWDRIKEVAS